MTAPNNQPAPEGFRRLSSKWLETNVAPKDVIFHYPYDDLWGPSQYQGKLIPSYDRSQFTYATARTDLPREAYADERAEDHCGVSSVEVPAKVLHTEKVRMKIGPEGVESVETDSERTIATLCAQLDAKEGECLRLKDDLSTAIDDGNRSRQIIYAMAEALKPETGEHNIDCAKRVAAERDKLRAEVEHRAKQRDEFQNLFIEASDGFNRRGEQLARLTAELDAVRKERDQFQERCSSEWAVAVERDAAQARCGELERAPVKSGEWLPIESAPKDGTYFLVGWFADEEPDPERFTTVVAFYGQILGTHLLSVPGKYRIGPQATHWQPLPAPPIAPEGKATEGEG